MNGIKTFMLSLRERVIDKYKKCLVTHGTQCLEMAHVVPRHICHHLGMTNLSHDINNCLLLHAGCHASFDRFCWTFDVYSAKPSRKPNYVYINTIASPTKHDVSLRMHISEIEIPLSLMPMLWVHYQVFLAIMFSHHRSICGFFRHCLQSDTLQYINTYGWWVHKEHINRVPACHLIHGQRTNGKYHVLMHGQAFDQSVWLDARDIPKDLITVYEDYKEHIEDPDYVP